MRYRSLFFITILSHLLTLSFETLAMNPEGEQFPVGSFRKAAQDQDSFPREQNNFDDEEKLTRFAQAIVRATLDGIFNPSQQESGRKEDDRKSEGDFKEVFDDEGSEYEELDPYLMHSLIENAPEKLKFMIKLYANRRSFALLSKNSCFKNKFLLYGPPGAGKGSLAKAFADYCGLPRQFIVGASLLNQYQHSGQQNLRLLFGRLLRKKNKNPHVVTFDEFSAIASQDDKKEKNNEEQMLSVLLNIIDQFEEHKNILFIATTNNIKDMPAPIKDRLFRIGFQNFISDS